jgi:hypothetical protein
MTTTLPPITERQFMEQVLQLAAIFGWEAVHFRPAETRHGWRTPVQGSMGKGWPDLVLVRDDRLIAAELKRDGAKATPEQERVLRLLGATGHVETYLWHPAAWDAITAILAL